MKFRVFFPLVLIVLTLWGCTSTQVIKPGYNFSGIRQVWIYEFQGSPDAPNSGDAVAQYIAAVFTKYGFSVHLLNSQNQLPSQAQGLIIKGSVLNYVPEHTQTIYTETNAGKRKRTIKYNEAQVSINVIAIDIATGQVVWSNDFSYEALDINTALYYATRGAVLPLISLIRG